ncbi:GNAT family N-acetyltransferase [Catenulispora rubra]|uniref:GNAT family N-acetyltransferase n=1 Tax=Catenulispora rubra TaxID=280293 RepID=UPI002B26B8FD|nr:GNAT family protein [Catenulispora rubra]
MLGDGPVRLRPLALSDAPAWRELKERNRAWLTRWEATVPPGDTSGRITFRQMVRRLRTEALAGRMLPFAIDYAEPPDPSDLLDAEFADNELSGHSRRGRRPAGKPAALAAPAAHRLVGQLTVSSITWGSLRSANIGYWVDETVAGRGITPTAVALAVDHCFRAAGMHRIEVCIRPENAASLRVVHKLGFRSEGLRRAYLHIDGGWRDHEAFALTAEEVPDGLLARWHVTLSSTGTTPAG